MTENVFYSNKACEKYILCYSHGLNLEKYFILFKSCSTMNHRFLPIKYLVSKLHKQINLLLSF